MRNVPSCRFGEICGPRLKHLVLLGSQARREATPNCDVGLLVVLEGPALQAHLISKRPRAPVGELHVSVTGKVGH